MLELVPISKTGYSRLKEELERLQREELPEVMRAVADAREHGDLRENAEYISGRERQGFIVGRISELKGMLNRSDIVDCTKADCGTAGFGTVVTLLDLATGERVTYQLWVLTRRTAAWEASRSTRPSAVPSWGTP